MRPVVLRGLSSSGAAGAAGRWFCILCAREEYSVRVEEDEARNRNVEQKIREEKRCEILQLQQKIGIGKRYMKLRFEDYCPTCPGAEKALAICTRYAASFASALENGDGLLLLGNPGTGKNHLSACICSQVVQQGYTALHVTVARLLGQIMSKWSKKEEGTDQDELFKFGGADLLVLDEVGVAPLNNHQKGYLFDLINLRYENLKPTILISNFNSNELGKYLENRIYDRLCQTSFVIEFTWESHRRK